MSVTGHAVNLLDPSGIRVNPRGEVRNYRVYGISISSEIPLSFPTEPPGCPADVTFRFASREWFTDVAARLSSEGTTNGWYTYSRMRDGSEFLHWPDLFEFVVSSDGRSVAFGLLGQSTAESFQTYLLGHVLSFALVKQGYEPLHATVVVVDGHALGFLGRSGHGKSTLAAAFLHGGHQVLTDDMLLIREVGGRLCGFPGPPRIKLFPDIARRFLPSMKPGAPMNPETDKLVVSLARRQVHTEPAPMQGFVVLDEAPEDASHVQLHPLSRIDAWLEFVKATFNTRLVGVERLQRQFLAVEEWTTRIPVRRLIYPRTLAVLESVRDALVVDMRSARQLVS